MDKVIPILLEWKKKLGGELIDNNLVFDNENCIGRIDGFWFKEEVQILRFNFKAKKNLEFSGEDFSEHVNYIPVFFEEPYQETPIDLGLIEDKKNDNYDLALNGAFCTNRKTNILFQFSPNKSIQFLSIRLEKNLFESFINQSSNLKKTLPLSSPFYVVEEFTPLIAGLYMRAYNIDTSEIFKDEMMYAIGIHLVSSFFAKLSERDLITEENKFPLSIKAVMQARNILRSRWDKGLTIDVLAKECGLGTSRLRALFKQTFGVTIHQFHNDVKLEVGRKMLLEGKLTTYIIAVELGFSSSSHFAASFKKKFGLSPTDYQKKHKKSIT